MQTIFITCESCHNRFKGAAATPSIIMRIEIPCPACNHHNKTSYGLVTPFFDQLFYIAGSTENPAIGSKVLLSKLGLNNAGAQEPKDAGIAEIFNAYLLWLENDQPENYTVEAPPKSCIYFLPPDEANAGIKKLLREKLQEILSAKDIEVALTKPAEGDGSGAFNVLRNIIIRLKDQGINAAYLIEKILQILG